MPMLLAEEIDELIANIAGRQHGGLGNKVDEKRTGAGPGSEDQDTNSAEKFKGIWGSRVRQNAGVRKHRNSTTRVLRDSSTFINKHTLDQTFYATGTIARS